MKLLCIGDVVGSPGRNALTRQLPALIRRHQVDFVVANGENLAHGAGITPATTRQLLEAGVDVITGGNHTWDRREGLEVLRDEPRVLRPANYPAEAGGRGHGVYTARNGRKVGVVNVQGRVFLPQTEDPFAAADQALAEIRRQTPIAIVDLHAEATSEKMALAWHLAGRATVLVGTHTHIPTADARVLPGGTAYVSDIGMTGSYDSVIGMQKPAAIERFLSGNSRSLEPAFGDERIYALLVEVDEATGRARSARLLEVAAAENAGGACRLLHGKPVAETVERGVATRAAALKERGVSPTLALLSVGDDPASAVYLARKEEAARRAGIAVRRLHWEAGEEPARVLAALDELGRDPAVHGILVQLPLPAGWDAPALQLAIHPDKDVDGLHPVNAGRLASGLAGFVPCTPLGIRALLRHYEIPIAGRRVVVVGRSSIVGRPLAALLSQKGEDATVTLAHSRSRDLPELAAAAEILVVAAGQPRFVDERHVGSGAVVIDVGVHRVPDDERPGKSRLVGDVDAEAVLGRAAALSPVPGGVGPLTVAFLLENTVWAAERAAAARPEAAREGR